MDDRFQETQQRDLADGGIDRVLGSRKATLIKNGRTKRFVILPYKAFEKLEADADEMRRARQIRAALDDPRPSIPWEVVDREMRQLLKAKLKKKPRGR